MEHNDNWLENALNDLMDEWMFGADNLEELARYDARQDPDSDYNEWEEVPEFGEDYLD